MLKALSKKVKRSEGFTLIELVIVVAIIGILVAIAMPRMVQARKNAAVGAHNANVRTLEGAGLMYIAERGDAAATGDITDEVKPYIQDWPKVPKLVAEAEGGSEKYTVSIATETDGDAGGVKVDPWYAELDDKGEVKFFDYPSRPGGGGGTTTSDEGSGGGGEGGDGDG